MYGQPNNYYFQPPQPQQQVIRGMEYLQNQYQPIVPSGLKGRPVSSIEEVRAAQIDFDGSLFIFPDIANKCIYTKQISATGSAILNKYNLQLDSLAETPIYVTKEEFDTIINQLKTAIESKDTLIAAMAANSSQSQTQASPKAASPQKEAINF